MGWIQYIFKLSLITISVLLSSCSISFRTTVDNDDSYYTPRDRSAEVSNIRSVNNYYSSNYFHFGNPYTNLGYNWMYTGYYNTRWRISHFWGPMWMGTFVNNLNPYPSFVYYPLPYYYNWYYGWYNRPIYLYSNNFYNRRFSWNNYPRMVYGNRQRVHRTNLPITYNSSNSHSNSFNGGRLSTQSNSVNRWWRRTTSNNTTNQTPNAQGNGSFSSWRRTTTTKTTYQPNNNYKSNYGSGSLGGRTRILGSGSGPTGGRRR